MDRPARSRRPGSDRPGRDAGARTTHRWDEGEDAVYFLSDYGRDDEFVGVVHAVLHRLAPFVPVVDLGHQVPPFDIAAGAAMLVRCAPYLGAGVVLAVVDPGVGTGRRGVAVEVAGAGPHWLVGPDNGLLVPLAGALGGALRVVELRPATLRSGWPPGAPRGGTFDGRDLFAPAAAHLALGAPHSELGSDADPASLVAIAVDPTDAAGSADPGAGVSAIDVTVTWVDRFGNVQLGVGASELDAMGLAAGDTTSVTILDEAAAALERAHAADASLPRRARRVDAFARLDVGELGLIIDSSGWVALVLREASAARGLRIGVGDRVRIGATDDSVAP